MREIKFRAWDKVDKEMKRVFALDFAEWWVATDYYNVRDKEGERNSFKNEETDRHILMQFTGQNDKNGIEIYESDILKDSRKRKFVVTWNNDVGNWANKPTDNGILRPCLNIGTVKGLEVIGNIYDNPELLESEGS